MIDNTTKVSVEEASNSISQAFYNIGVLTSNALSESFETLGGSISQTFEQIHPIIKNAHGYTNVYSRGKNADEVIWEEEVPKAAEVADEIVKIDAKWLREAKDSISRYRDDRGIWKTVETDKSIYKPFEELSEFLTIDEREQIFISNTFSLGLNEVWSSIDHYIVDLNKQGGTQLRAKHIYGVYDKKNKKKWTGNCFLNLPRNYNRENYIRDFLDFVKYGKRMNSAILYDRFENLGSVLPLFSNVVDLVMIPDSLMGSSSSKSYVLYFGKDQEEFYSKFKDLSMTLLVV